MLDAIERARAERRLAWKIAAVLLIVVALLYALGGWGRGRPAPKSVPSVAGEQVK